MREVSIYESRAKGNEERTNPVACRFMHLYHEGTRRGAFAKEIPHVRLRARRYPGGISAR